MDSYTNLLSAVTAMAEDNSTEFSDFLPKAVHLAEARLFRNLDFDFSSTASMTTVNGAAEVNKPTGHRLTHNLYVTVSNEKIRLLKKTEDFLYSYWPNPTVTGIPKYYGDKDTSVWTLAPTPNGNYTLTYEIIKQPDLLGPTNETNVFTTYFPDALFYATMSVMCEFMKDMERKQEWEAKYSDSINTANNEGRRYRQDDATNNHNTNGGRNVLEKDKA